MIVNPLQPGAAVLYCGVSEEKLNIHRTEFLVDLKVGLSPSKKMCVICFIESPLKMMKNAFYFVSKALFVLKIFTFLSQLFGHVEKTA